jgi:hypothetical protein
MDGISDEGIDESVQFAGERLLHLFLSENLILGF